MDDDNVIDFTPFIQFLSDAVARSTNECSSMTNQEGQVAGIQQAQFLYAGNRQLRQNRHNDLARENLGRMLYHDPNVRGNNYHYHHGNNYVQMNYYANPQTNGENRSTWPPNEQQSDSRPERSADENRRQDVCPVCLDRRAEMAIYRCGHRLCEVCGPRIRSGNGQCPTCRQPIEDIFRLH